MSYETIKALTRIKVATHSAISQIGREYLVLDAFKACERDFGIDQKKLYGEIEKLDPELFVDVQHVLLRFKKPTP